ncbi:MAG: efflux RND transporter periplasmic adaptor subunit [Marinilabiliaceae bacterium]|nr:efflux RND transporter periplasmic adaptor subunit [Marinilabiliaceae bacterium]
MKKYIKIFIGILIAVIFIWTFVFLYQKSQPKETKYEIVKAEISCLERTTLATGKIEPRDEIDIKPQISGIISEIYKEAGQSIKEGDIIAKVKVIPELGQLNSAESRVRLAEMELKQSQLNEERSKNLLEKKFISQEEYENDALKLKQAQEELQVAKDQLEIVRDGITKSSASMSSTLIRSTITGLILDVPVKIGNSVIQANTMNDGTTIATIADMNDLIFRGNIDETEVGRIHEGMPVKITLGAIQDMSFNATLEYISPKGVEENGANQFEIKASITVPDSVTIRSGYSANAEIVLQSAKDVLCIPESVIEFSGDSSFVSVLTDSLNGQVFERRQITTGMSDGVKIEVKSGITLEEPLQGKEIEVED